MSAMVPLYELLGISPLHLTKDEMLLVEMQLFVQVCGELKEIFRSKYKPYFYLMKFTMEMETDMLDSNFASLIIKDILLTGEYSLVGIARYTNTHEDIINEIVIGQNTNPSGMFLRKVIELHLSVRRDLYREIMEKIKLQN